MGWSLDLMCVLVYVWEVAEMEEGCGSGTDMYVPREVGRMTWASWTTTGSLDGTAVLWFWLEWKCNQAGEKKRHGALVSSKITGRCPFRLRWRLASLSFSILPSVGARGWLAARWHSAAALPQHAWGAGRSPPPPPGATWKCFLKGL